MTCECGNEKIRKDMCEECRHRETIRYEDARRALRRRIVTTLSRHDLPILAFDLRVAMELGEHEGMSLSAELGRLVASGEIASQRIKGGVVYRIAERRAA